MSAGFLECLRQLTELRRKDMALRDAAITLLDSRSVVSGDGLCLVPASRLDALRAALAKNPAPAATPNATVATRSEPGPGIVPLTVTPPGECPTCGCTDPTHHPAVQSGGEVQLCENPWHRPTAAEIRAREACEEASTAATPAPQVRWGNYIQNVPEHCDRIIWRGRYYHLPLPGDSAANSRPDAPMPPKMNKSEWPEA